MTAAQLTGFISNKIATKVNFDWTKTTEAKFIYLGQTRTEHFFVLRISPASVKTNASQISEAVKLLDEYGFQDTHWVHDAHGPNTYCYYCFIEDKTMSSLK